MKKRERIFPEVICFLVMLLVLLFLYNSTSFSVSGGFSHKGNGGRSFKSPESGNTFADVVNKAYAALAGDAVANVINANIELTRKLFKGSSATDDKKKFTGLKEIKDERYARFLAVLENIVEGEQNRKKSADEIFSLLNDNPGLDNAAINKLDLGGFRINKEQLTSELVQAAKNYLAAEYKYIYTPNLTIYFKLLRIMTESRSIFYHQERDKWLIDLGRENKILKSEIETVNEPPKVMIKSILIFDDIAG